MRSFVAVHLDLAAHNEVLSVLDVLRSAYSESGVGWTRPENLHLTLRFLGNVEDAELPALTDVLEGAAYLHEPFALTLGRFGAFPSLRNPRVLWVGVEESLSLLGLQKDIESAVSGLVRHQEDRPFHAHITLGRVKVPSGLRSIRGPEVNPVSWQVDSFQLMGSSTGRGGPTYSIIESFAL